MDNQSKSKLWQSKKIIYEKLTEGEHLYQSTIHKAFQRVQIQNQSSDCHTVRQAEQVHELKIWTHFDWNDQSANLQQLHNSATEHNKHIDKYEMQTPHLCTPGYVTQLREIRVHACLVWISHYWPME